MASERFSRSDSRFPRGDQGPAYNACGRRDTFVECGAAADSGSLFVRTTSAVFRGSSLPRETAGKIRRGDFPREYRRRLYWHRVEKRIAGSEEAAGIFE